MRLAGLHSVLRDPLYRWEVRRYWTWQRYAGAALLIAVCWAAVLAHFHWLATMFVAPSLLYILLLRLPLHLLASTGAALGLVEERSSGLLEQFQLTPVDPWRFHLVRWVGRLKGVVWLWALSTAVAWAVITVTFFADFGESLTDGLVVSLVVLAVHLDAGVMVLAGASAGAYFTAMCRTSAAALIRTWLAAILYEGFSLFMGGMVGVAVMLFVKSGQRVGSELWGLAALLLVRLGFGVLITALNLGWARPASGFVFADPEDGK